MLGGRGGEAEGGHAARLRGRCGCGGPEPLRCPATRDGSHTTPTHTPPLTSPGRSSDLTP